MDEIKSAAYRQDYDALQRQGAAIARNVAGSSRERRRPIESASDVPVVTEFRYGERILAGGMFASESLPVATASVLYGGGPLAGLEFQAVDYFYPDRDTDIEHVVIVSLPWLSELEQAIDRLVPQAAGEQRHAESARTLLGVRTQSREKPTSE